MPGQTTKTPSKPSSAPRQDKPKASQPKTSNKPQAPKAPVQQTATAQKTTGEPKKNKVVVNQPQTGTQYGDKSKKNRPQRTKESTKRQAMLNTHRINPFKYDMKEILEASSMDPAKASSFLATVIAKASRVSTRDAKDFIKTFQESGDLTKSEVDSIFKLLDKYSRYR